MTKKTRRMILLGSVAALLGTRGNSQDFVPTELLKTPDDLEVKVFAKSPVLHNPTNMDVDRKGRIWVAEGVNYRKHYNRQPEGDRIVVLEDTDGDGVADKSWTFVQDPALRAPMGIAVLDNKVIVSMAPEIIVYTDVNRDGVFDPAVDKKEILLTGFNGRVHDHTVHSITFGPDGQYYFNVGNAGAMFTDKSGKTYRVGSEYDPYYGSKPLGDLGWNPRAIAGQKSDDGHVYVGGFAARMNPDGRAVHIIGQNFRNSYEQAVTSFGDVFQNDNDDPPACRTAFLMEYGNAGFCSFDGQRGWGADRRPGQSVPTAEWRQEDPGTMPAGDVYGGGAPTGIAFYETGAWGDKYQGLLLSCEAARNTVFGYFPKPDGAGFKLERFDFLTSNKEGKFAGTDFKGGGRSVNSELNTFFRPSDVTVGADGAIYVADWFDPRVGGHDDQDNKMAGAIYRIAPKGFMAKVPDFNLETVAGQIEALKSPAVNVRSLGFERLKAQGAKAVPAVAKLLNDKNPYFRARAIWLLSQMGPSGVAKVEAQLKSKDAQTRVVAFRAIRRADARFLATAAKLATDPSPAVRREVALSMRDVPLAQAQDILAAIARGYDGADRWYLEALGTGCDGKEAAVYDLLLKQLGNSDSLKWTPAFTKIAWRLHPEQSVAAFKARALSPGLSDPDRKASLVALGYIPTSSSANAVADVASGTTNSTVKADAVWWLLNRKDNHWKGSGLDVRLKRDGIYDPDKLEIVEAIAPEPPVSKLPPLGDILKIKGDLARGKAISTACQTCHRINGAGTDYAPDISAFAKMQPSEVVLRSIVDPSADIASGYGGQKVITTDGVEVDGLVLSNGDPVIVRSAGGLTQMIPAKRVKSKKAMDRSLMLSAEQMGLGPQELADVLAYLRSL